MPRPRKTSSLSPENAAQALSILIHDGKLKLQDVARALRRREQMIRELRDRLASLGHETSGAMKSLARRRGRPRTVQARRPARKPKRISKAQRVARQAQGRYLGAIRRLPAKSRAKVKAIREKAGVRAAIAAAKKMPKA